jgi:hypothetical protein
MFAGISIAGENLLKIYEVKEIYFDWKITLISYFYVFNLDVVSWNSLENKIYEIYRLFVSYLKRCQVNFLEINIWI